MTLQKHGTAPRFLWSGADRVPLGFRIQIRWRANEYSIMPLGADWSLRFPHPADPAIGGCYRIDCKQSLKFAPPGWPWNPSTERTPPAKSRGDGGFEPTNFDHPSDAGWLFPTRR